MLNGGAAVAGKLIGSKLMQKCS